MTGWFITIHLTRDLELFRILIPNSHKTNGLSGCAVMGSPVKVCKRAFSNSNPEGCLEQCCKLFCDL